MHNFSYPLICFNTNLPNKESSFPIEFTDTYKLNFVPLIPQIFYIHKEY